MVPYRGVETKIHEPVAQPVPGSPVPGERTARDGVRVLECWGYLRLLKAKLEDTPLGQGGRQIHRWRGQLPDEVEPQPGWTVEIGEQRYQVLVAVWMFGRTWRLDLERTE
ncbi:MAG: hypothetical protein FJX74_12125 [Armatimonadetes bacterium]|nr:hypothetical protein [Armatimonadota bacterium]